MIFTEKKITINNDQCKIDTPVVLYRGDYNVEVRFTIVSSPYKYSNKQETNVTESTEASFGQLIINVPNSKPIFSDVTPVESDGAIIFTIKKEMIDESIELGEYDFQIRLFDENQQSRATIPPVIQGIKIKEPIAVENETNVAQVNYGSTSTSTPLDSFDSDGNYIETSWKDRDLITDSKLNKIEKALTGINNKAKDIEGSIPTKTSQLTNDSGYVTDTEMRTAIENKNTIYDSRMTNIETKNTEQDNRLDIAENRLDNIGNDITNTMQPIIDDHASRLDAIEAVDVAQNSRLDAIEVKNQQQDDRLLDIEKANKRQDNDLKCLFAASKNNMIDITEEGNSIYLQNSTIGYTSIDEIKGNTLVNCNKEANKELILNGNINTSGDNNITITEGVDGGLVDVSLEGNTLVNVSKTKDSTAISKAYTVENSGNHIALQGNYDGNCRPVITGNTLWVDTDTEEVLTAFDETKNLRLQSTFEDSLVTQEMVDSGEEVADNLGKYKVEYTVTGKNKFDKNKTLDRYEINISDGTVAISADWFVTDFIPVIPNTSYKISGKASGGGVLYYGKNKQLISTAISGGTSLIVIPDNVRYIRLNGPLTQKDTFQLEEGDTATSYEPYKEYTKTLYLNSPPLEGDTIEEKDGCIYHVHRFMQSVLDGSDDENWIMNINNDTYFSAYTDVFKSTQDKLFICDKFICKKWTDISDNYTECIWSNDPTSRGIIISKSKLSTQDMAGFKQYLQQNPVTVVYELSSPTYELIEQSNLAIPSYANGHLDFNTAVPVEKVDFLSFSEELTYLYANTQYTVQFVSDKATTADITLGGTSLLAQSIVEGLNRIAITTPETLVDNKLILDGIGANISKVVVTDTDREFGYFEGMKSVGECEELAITSANSDSTLLNAQQLTHEPLRAVGDAKDRYVLIYGKWSIEKKCGIRAYQEGDKDNYKTDLINTVYPLEMPTYEEIDYNPLEVYSDVTHITTNSTIPCNIIVKNHGFNCLLKPSTTYTVSSNLGLNTVTTGANIGDSCLRFYDTDTSDVTTMKDVLVLEGDWTTKADLIPANFSGIESAFEQELVTDENDEHYGKYKVNARVVGKNLFDMSKTKVAGNILDKGSNYIIVNNEIIDMSYCCDFNPNSQYTLSWELEKLENDNMVGFEFIYTDGTSDYLIRDIKSTLTSSPGKTISEIRLTYNSTGKSKISNIQLEEGDTATEYEPYKESNITFYIEEPLRGVGTAKNKVYVKNDKVVVQRNCTELIINDTNLYTISEVNNNYPSVLRLWYDSKYMPNFKEGTILCDTLPSYNGYNGLHENISGIGYSNGLDIHLPLPTISTIDEVREYLKNNPLKIVYQLAEPTYEEVEYNDVKLFIESFKNSTLFYNSNVPVTSKLYYSYSVPIVDKVAQTASIADEQDQLIIDLATQCAVMEMFLM